MWLDMIECKMRRVGPARVVVVLLDVAAAGGGSEAALVGSKGEEEWLHDMLCVIVVGTY